MPAMMPWSRSTPLICVRRPASRPASVSMVKSAASGSGAEGGDAGHLGRVADQVDGQALLGPLLGQVEPGAVVEPQPERQRALARLGRRRGQVVAPAQPAGPGQVRDQVQALVGGQVQELAVPADLGDHLSGEGRQRGIERLQHRERGGVGTRDGMADRVLAQEGGQRLHFRQFRHASSLPRANGRFAPVSGRFNRPRRPGPAARRGRRADGWHRPGGACDRRARRSVRRSRVGRRPGGRT